MKQGTVTLRNLIQYYNESLIIKVTKKCKEWNLIIWSFQMMSWQEEQMYGKESYKQNPEIESYRLHINLNKTNTTNTWSCIIKLLVSLNLAYSHLKYLLFFISHANNRLASPCTPGWSSVPHHVTKLLTRSFFRPSLQAALSENKIILGDVRYTS